MKKSLYFLTVFASLGFMPLAFASCGDIDNEIHCTTVNNPSNKIYKLVMNIPNDSKPQEITLCHSESFPMSGDTLLGTYTMSAYILTKDGQFEPIPSAYDYDVMAFKNNSGQPEAAPRYKRIDLSSYGDAYPSCTNFFSMK